MKRFAVLLVCAFIVGSCEDVPDETPQSLRIETSCRTSKEKDCVESKDKMCEEATELSRSTAPHPSEKDEGRLTILWDCTKVIKTESQP